MLTCATCGRENPDDVRFCGNCGRALTTADAREVRKTVTILFADVTGSTALGERLDPEALRRVMGRYFDEMRGVLEQHGGTVEKFIGDAVMAVFGIPTLHEDDALRAVLAASAMRERLAELNHELERDFGVGVEARIGVNTGEVVTGQGESGQRLATGDAVNVAARLEQAAAPGQILLGERTLELVRHAVEAEAVELLSLKGKTDRVAGYGLVQVDRGAATVERRLDAPLVGRSDELASARAVFERSVSARRCELVTVAGPPGIGKSRLAREVSAALRDEATVLTGRCLPYGDGITYWPLREIFAAAGGERELDEALAEAAPEDVAWAVRKALERRARKQPLVLVIEDIHWAEPTLLDLIEHLADWTRDAPLLLLCLARPELLDERPAWGRRESVIISLEPLTGRQSEELIEELLGSTQLDGATRSRISEVAEGNPLFVEQLLAMVAEGDSDARVPPTIQALLAARLDALPDEEREVLERAAVIGLEFEWEALGELTAERSRPTGAQLSALVRKELIRPDELLEDSFRFRHILIRDAAYERIPKELRSDLHERFADWLEPHGEEFADIVAYHLEQAYRSIAELGPIGARAQALADRAAEYLIAAGKRARGRGDERAAASLLERAVSILPADDVSRLRTLPTLGRVLREAGRLDASDSVLTEALDRGRAANDRLVVADAALTRADVRFHRALISRDEVLRELEGALRTFRDLGDDAALARGLSLGGMLRFWLGEVDGASEDLSQSARLAREAGDRAEEVQSLEYVLAAAVHGSAPVSEGLDRVEEIRPRATTSGRLEMTLLQTHAALIAMQGNFDLARDLISQAAAVAAEHGFGALQTMYVNRAAGANSVLEGNPAAAEVSFRSACELLEQIGELGRLASLAPQLADVLFLLGRDGEALEVTERWPAERITSPADADAQTRWRLVQGKLFARRGDVEEGERLARAAVAMIAPTDYLNLRAQAAADLGEVLRLADRLDEATAAIREAIRLYETKGNAAAAQLLAGAAVSST